MRHCAILYPPTGDRYPPLTLESIAIVKELCKLKKDDLKEVLPVLAAQTDSLRYICKKCGRLAPGKEWICKPVAIRKLLDGDCSE